MRTSGNGKQQSSTGQPTSPDGNDGKIIENAFTSKKIRIL